MPQGRNARSGSNRSNAQRSQRSQSRAKSQSRSQSRTGQRQRHDSFDLGDDDKFQAQKPPHHYGADYQMIDVYDEKHGTTTGVIELVPSRHTQLTHQGSHHAKHHKTNRDKCLDALERGDLHVFFKRFCHELHDWRYRQKELRDSRRQKTILSWMCGHEETHPEKHVGILGNDEAPRLKDDQHSWALAFVKGYAKAVDGLFPLPGSHDDKTGHRARFGLNFFIDLAPVLGANILTLCSLLMAIIIPYKLNVPFWLWWDILKPYFHAWRFGMVPVVGAYWAAEVQPDLHAASVLEDWLTLLEKTEEDTIDGKDYYSEGLSEILGEPEGIYYSSSFRRKLHAGRRCCCCSC